MLTRNALRGAPGSRVSTCKVVPIRIKTRLSQDRILLGRRTGRGRLPLLAQAREGLLDDGLLGGVAAAGDLVGDEAA